jgi:archaea-specific DNA-binding protein
MMTDDHAIFVGGKPFMNYVTAVVMQFTTKGANTVVVRSRGKFISRAVDVAEVVQSRFLKDQVGVTNMAIDSEEFQNKEGRTVRVSTLDIHLSRVETPVTKMVPVKEKTVEPVSVIEESTPVEEPAEEVEETETEKEE